MGWAFCLQLVGFAPELLSPRRLLTYPQSFVISRATRTKDYTGARGVRRLQSLEEFELGQTPVGLWVLGGAAASLFLMSCFSVGGLFLARSMAGRRELAIASAIGAGPGVVVRKALLESAIAVLVSALAAWAFTLVATPLVLSRLPVASRFGVGGTGIDIAVLAALSAFAVILIALPTTVSIRPGHLFRTIASGLSGEGSLLGWQKPLIAATTAIAMVLVTAAGLLVRSYVELVSTDLGFRPDNVLSLQVGSPEGANGRARRAFFRGLVERIESLDGVVAAASVSNRPLLHGAVGDDGTFINEYQTEADRDTNPTLNYVVVSPRYFRVMGIRLVAGRSFGRAGSRIFSRCCRRWGISCSLRVAVRECPGPTYLVGGSRRGSGADLAHRRWRCRRCALPRTHHIATRSLPNVRTDRRPAARRRRSHP